MGFDTVIFIVGCIALLVYWIHYSEQANQKDRIRIREREARQDGRISALLESLSTYFNDFNDDYVHSDQLKRRMEASSEVAGSGQYDFREDYLRAFIRDIKASNYSLLAQHPDRIQDDELTVLLSDKDYGKHKVEGLYGDEYKVDVGNRDCSCDYLCNLPRGVGTNDARRICRHQVEVLKKIDPNVLHEATPLIKQILEQIHRDQFYGYLYGEGFTALIRYSQPLEWVNIESEEFGDYSYNMREKRWSSGASPSGYAREIKSLLMKYFRLDAYRNS